MSCYLNVRIINQIINSCRVLTLQERDYSQNVLLMDVILIFFSSTIQNHSLYTIHSPNLNDNNRHNHLTMNSMATNQYPTFFQRPA